MHILYAFFTCLIIKKMVLLIYIDIMIEVIAWQVMKQWYIVLMI